MDSKDYKKIKDLYEDHFWFQPRKNLIYKMLKNFFSSFDQNRLILDIGCGTGINLEEIQKFGAVTCLEKDKTALEILEKKCKNIIVENIENAKLEENKYDAICCFDVLEHLENDTEILKKINASLKTRGYLLFTVPAFNAIFGPHDIALEHYRRYDKKNLQKKLEKANFVNSEFYYWNSLLFPVIFIIRALKKIIFSWRNKTAEIETKKINKNLNRTLRFFLEIENKLFFKKSWLPYGLSIYGFARKK